jgi:hypothetical protein
LASSPWLRENWWAVGQAKAANTNYSKATTEVADRLTT